MIKSLLKHRIFKRLLFYLIGITAYYYLINRLVTFEHYDSLKNTFQLSGRMPLLILLFFCLWLVNLCSESRKWQILISPFQTISLKNALLHYLAGSFTAVGSPGRLAEPGGRMLLVDRTVRIHAVIMTTVGGILQNAVIAIAGLIVVLVFGFPLSVGFFNGGGLSYSIIFFLIILVAFLTLMLLFRKKIRLILAELKTVKTTIIFKALLFTLIRYIAFNLQLYVILLIFNVQMDLITFFSLSPIYFFIITLIPSFIFADLGIRGSAAILIFKNSDIQEPVLLSVILVVWLFNVLLPAVTGGWILSRKSSLSGNQSI